MNIVATATFFGFTLGEWVAITSLITFLFGVATWVVRRGYTTLKDNIVKPIIEMLDELRTAIDGLSKNVDSENKWIHEQHAQVVKRLEDHENQLDNHTIRLVRIETKNGIEYKEE